MGIKNAEFYADFESVEKVGKKLPEKNYRTFAHSIKR
jgi:hypothetical protein